MKKFFTIAMLALCPLLSYAGENDKSAYYLPPSTPVQVIIDKEIDSDDVKVGENVDARLASPVKYKGNVVIPAGTPVKGSVTRRKNNFIAGIAGSVEVGNFKILMPTGDIIPLTGSVQRKGDGRVGVSLIGAYFIGLPIFIKGQDGKIENGTETTMYTAQEWEWSPKSKEDEPVTVLSTTQE